MLDKIIEKKVKEVVFSVIPSKEIKVFIFGSRATGNASRFSDIDLGIKGSAPISGVRIAEIKELFEDSNLPFKVDVVDFSRVSKKFSDVATKRIIALN